MLVLLRGHVVLSDYFRPREYGSVALNYLLSKTSQNIETDCSLFQNYNKQSFSVVLLFSLVFITQGRTVLFS